MIGELSDLTFQTRAVADVSRAQWLRLADINHQAIEAAYGDSPQMLQHPDVQRQLLGENLETFKRPFVFPSAENSARSTQQLFENPRITMALLGGRQVVAWAYSVDNTSGEAARQKMDERWPLKRWLKIGWLATDPEFGHMKLARWTAAHAIAESKLLQPVSAYSWPGDFAHKALVMNGLRPQEPAVDLAAAATKDKLPTRRYVSHTNKKQLPRTVVRVKGLARGRRFLHH